MPTGNNWKAHEGDWIFMSSPGSRMIQFHGLPIPLPLLMRASSVYPDMSSRRGNEKWVLTFSFIMVTMLKVYLMVLNDRILGSVLKHALHREKISKFQNGNLVSISIYFREKYQSYNRVSKDKEIGEFLIVLQLMHTSLSFFFCINSIQGCRAF